MAFSKRTILFQIVLIHDTQIWCPSNAATSLVNDQVYVSPSVGDHSFSTFSFSTQNFPKNLNFLPPDMHTYVCVSGGKKC